MPSSFKKISFFLFCLLVFTSRKKVTCSSEESEENNILDTTEDVVIKNNKEIPDSEVDVPESLNEDDELNHLGGVNSKGDVESVEIKEQENIVNEELSDVGLDSLDTKEEDETKGTEDLSDNIKESEDEMENEENTEEAEVIKEDVSENTALEQDKIPADKISSVEDISENVLESTEKDSTEKMEKSADGKENQEISKDKSDIENESAVDSSSEQDKLSIREEIFENVQKSTDAKENEEPIKEKPESKEETLVDSSAEQDKTSSEEDISENLEKSKDGMLSEEAIEEPSEIAEEPVDSLTEHDKSTRNEDLSWDLKEPLDTKEQEKMVTESQDIKESKTELTVSASVSLDVEQGETSNDSDKISVDVVDSADVEAFKPTSQWQTIKEGQSIPAGLHVRINLQTGEKEAKLMPEGELEDKESKDKEESQDGPSIVQVDQIDKKRVEDALKDFEDKFHGTEDLNNMTEEQEKAYKEELLKKYRSIDEIKKELEGYDLFPKTDAQIMLEHVQVLNDSSSTTEQKQAALDELEFLVHQVDNARDLDIIGGLPLVVKALNDSEDKIRERAAYVLGSAAQSNTPVQAAILNMGAMPTLLKLLSSPQQSLLVRRRVMFALSSTVRLFEAGKEEFLHLQGVDILMKLFSQPKTEDLRLKAVILLTDLITEEVNELVKKPKNKYLDNATLAKKTNLVPVLVQNGWCEKIFTLLQTKENDVLEKVIQTLHLLRVGCTDFLGRPEIFSKLDKLNAEFERLSIEEQDPDKKEYFESLTNSVTDLLSKLVD